MKYLLVFMLFFLAPLHSVEKYNLSICAIFQNEAKYLAEWIDFHKSRGVEHFYLYNNLSTDNYPEVLVPYICHGIVDVYDWPYFNEDGFWIPHQCSAYNNCLKNADSKWIAFLDIDEFLFSPMNKDLNAVLKYYDKFPGISVNWMMYGTSNVHCENQTKILPYLTYRAADNFPAHLITKCIVQTRLTKECLNPHVFKFYNDQYAVDELFREVQLGQTLTNSVNILRINHYWTRDISFFYNEKIPRREKYGDSREETLRLESQMNQVYDPILAN